MATRYSGTNQADVPVVYTIDNASATVSATVTALTSCLGLTEYRVHNWGTPDIYARVSLDGTNFSPGNDAPLFTKLGGSTNAYLSTNAIGTISGPFRNFALMQVEAGSAKVTFSIK